ALWDPPPTDAWPGLPHGMSISEYWVKTVIADYRPHAEKAINLVGPLPKNEQQVAKALRAAVAEEHLWQERLWKIYEYSQETGKEWGDDEFMAFVETVVPRSWHCDPFADHPC